MLIWLAMAAALLTGLFVIFQNHVAVIDPAVAWSAAVAVVAVLTAYYFFFLRSQPVGNYGTGVVLTALLLLAAGGVAWWYNHLSAAPSLENQTTPSVKRQEASASVSVLIRRSPDEHFVTRGQINGADALFLVDTGASVVMLTPTDAERAGIDLKTLTFTVPVQSANGTLYAAPVRVRSISVGLLKVEDVEALVARPGSLNENLLGMSFLRRLASYNFSGEFLTLRQ
jgi:aspartyl protease family protein